MSWQPAAKNDYSEIRNFITSREWVNLTFSSKLKEASAGKAAGEILLNRSGPSGTITEAVMITPHGQLIPVLNNGAYACRESYSPGLLPLLSESAHNIYSIIGTEDSVRTCESLIGVEPFKVYEYYLMVLSSSGFKAGRTVLPHGFSLRRAKPKDLEKVYPIQRLYELEEVCIYPSQFNERTCLAHLKDTLKNQIVLYLEKEGSIVAKAQTNARGYSADQIGGVITIAGHRKRGLSRLVMESLLKMIFAEKPTACLFVKKANLPAISLYKSLNFRFTEGYRIAYYV